MSIELDKLKKELEDACSNPNITMEELTKISTKIDDKVAEMFLNKQIEKIDYDKNYKELLERKDREDIINLIKNDLVKEFNINDSSSLDKLEITRTANYLYDFCCLTVHGIAESDIIHFITRKSWYSYDLYAEDRGNIKLTSDKNYNKIIKELQNKYIEILKNK